MRIKNRSEIDLRSCKFDFSSFLVMGLYSFVHETELFYYNGPTNKQTNKQKRNKLTTKPKINKWNKHSNRKNKVDTTAFFPQKINFSFWRHPHPPPEMSMVAVSISCCKRKVVHGNLPLGKREKSYLFETFVFYQCWKNPSLLFTDPPKFLKESSGDTKSEGQSVSLECQVEGKPKLTVTWLKDGAEVNSTGDSRITASNNLDTWTLNITQLNRTDEGNYTCYASNSLENQTSTTAQLTVNCKSLSFVSPRHTLSCKHTQKTKIDNSV